MDGESGESTEGEDVTGAGKEVRDREIGIRLTESRELIPETR